MIEATEALQRLRDGNRRYVAGTSKLNPNDGHRRGLEKGQTPFAVVLACSDSRVPVETIFDHTSGDLFVLRVAGNIAAPSQLGSIEYAASVLGSKLVVVLGHSNCGAVSATLGAISDNQSIESPNLAAIVDRIRPALKNLDEPTLHEAVAANVRHTVAQLPDDSPVLAQLIDSGELTVIGAEYSIEEWCC